VFVRIQQFDIWGHLSVQLISSKTKLGKRAQSYKYLEETAEILLYLFFFENLQMLPTG